jgi:hypothetical protein
MQRDHRAEPLIDVLDPEHITAGVGRGGRGFTCCA